MNGAAINGQCRLFYRFIQSRVAMTGTGNILSRRTECHRRGAFMNHRTSLMPDNMHAKHLIGAATGKDFNKPVTMTLGAGAAVR